MVFRQKILILTVLFSVLLLAGCNSELPLQDTGNVVAHTSSEGELKVFKVD